MTIPTETFLAEVFRDFSEVFRGPLGGRFPSQRLSVLLPLIVLHLEFSPKIDQFQLLFRRPGFAKQCPAQKN